MKDADLFVQLRKQTCCLPCFASDSSSTLLDQFYVYPSLPGFLGLNSLEKMLRFPPNGEDTAVRPSHRGLIPRWDEELIAELEKCQSPKAILSGLAGGERGFSIFSLYIYIYVCFFFERFKCVFFWGGR